MRSSDAYRDFTMADVVAAVRPGRPETLLKCAEAFRIAGEAMRTVHNRLPAMCAQVTSGDTGSWSGPAASAFVEYASRVSRGVALKQGSPDACVAALTYAAHALTRAKAELADYVRRVDRRRETAPTRGTRVDEDAINAGARSILDRLAAAYAEAGACLTVPDPKAALVLGEPYGAERCVDEPFIEATDAAIEPGPRSGLVAVSLGNPTAPALGVVTGVALVDRRRAPRGATTGVVDVGLGNPASACAVFDGSLGGQGGLASTHRLPGLGAGGYTPPPNAPVTVRTRPGAGVLASELLRGGRTALRPDAGDEDRDEGAVQKSAVDGVIGRPWPSRVRADG